MDIPLLAIRHAIESDLARAVQIGTDRKHAFRACQTSASFGTIAKYFASDATREDLADYECGLGIHAQLIQPIVGGIVVRGYNDNAAPLAVIGKVGAAHTLATRPLHFNRPNPPDPHTRSSPYLRLPPIPN